MGQPKTRPEKASVAGFLERVEPASRREECRAIARLMRQATGSKPQMWGTSIVGFGRRTYQGASGATDWPLVGFSPRKQALTLYIMSGLERHPKLLARLGKHTTGKACLYLKSLDDIDMDVLKELVEASVKTVRESDR
jgi:hypothetical protein